MNHVLPFNHRSTNAPLAAADYYLSVSVSGIVAAPPPPQRVTESPSHCDFATTVAVNLQQSATGCGLAQFSSSLVQIVTKAHW